MRRAPTTAVTDPAIAAVLVSAATHNRKYFMNVWILRMYTKAN